MSSFLVKFFLDVKKQRIILASLFFLFFISSFLQPYSSMVGINSNIFAILLIVYLFIYSHFHRNTNKIYPFLFCLAFIVLRFVSLCWGFNSEQGINVVETHYLTLGMMLIMCFVISIIKTDSSTIKCVFSSYYFASLIILFLQLFFHKPFASVANRQVITLFGGQDDPNQLGAILNIAVCFSLFYAIKISKLSIRILNIVFYLLSFFSICLTGSRGALLSFVLISLCSLAFFIYTNRHGSKTRLLIIIAIIAAFSTVSVILAFYLLPNNIVYRLFFEGFGDGSGRLSFWNDSFQLIKERPLFGYGWGGVYVRVHNTFISIALDNGLFGLFLFLCFLLVIIFRIYQKKSFLCLSLLLSSLICSFFIEAITLRFLWIGFFISILATNNLKTITADKKKSLIYYYSIEI